jgi:hypothetical protein
VPLVVFLLIQKLSRRGDSDRTARHGAMAPRHHNIENPAYDANTVKQVCVNAVAHCTLRAATPSKLCSRVACLGPKKIIAIGLPVYTVLAPISALHGGVVSMPLVSCGGVAKAQRESVGVSRTLICPHAALVDLVAPRRRCPLHSSAMKPTASLLACSEFRHTDSHTHICTCTTVGPCVTLER